MAQDEEELELVDEVGIDETAAPENYPLLFLIDGKIHVAGDPVVSRLALTDDLTQGQIGPGAGADLPDAVLVALYLDGAGSAGEG